MWRRVYILLPIILMCLIVVIGAESGVVMSNVATRGQTRAGQLCIPSEDIEMDLYRVYDDCVCCYLGLYNGGRVEVRGIDLSDVGIECTACIEQEDVYLVLECVEIVDCVKIGGTLLSLRGVVHVEGDVLIVMCDCFPFVKVWRMTVL
jgi:hypothetical protein